jgi:hypothetical protein
MLRFPLAFCWRGSYIYLDFSAFTSRPIYLLASIEVSVFLHGMLSSNRSTSSEWSSGGFVPFTVSPTSFSSSFLLAYSKPKLESSG